jgi:hypothetical protein
MKPAKKTFIERLQNMPIWKHGLIIVLGVALWRLARSLGVTVALILFVIIVGPLWFIPLPGQGTWVQFALLLPLTLAYYSPLVLVKRKITYRGKVAIWNKKWIGLVIGYAVSNLAAIALVIIVVLAAGQNAA